MEHPPAPAHRATTMASHVERRRQQILWCCDGFEVGHFVARPDSSLFREAASPGHLAIVFPRRAVGLDRERQSLLADNTKVLLHNPWTTYRRRVVDPLGDECFWYWAAEALLDEIGAAGLLRGTGDGLEFTIGELPCDRFLFLLERRVAQAATAASDEDDLRVEESVLQMLETLVRLAGFRTPLAKLQPAERSMLDRVDEFLAAEFASSPNLDRIAAVAGCSKFHLARMYRTSRGCTLHGRRSELQLRAAYDLVLGGGSSMTEIAMELGFASPSHLSSRFRQWFGVSPSLVRAASVCGRGDRARS